MDKRMGRGRPWRGSGPMEPFRDGGGYRPRGRGYFPGPPRLSRPPWPHHPGSSELYYNRERNDAFSSKQFRGNSQRGYHHGVPRFHRSGCGERSDHKRMPLQASLDRPPPLLHLLPNSNQQNSVAHTEQYDQDLRDHHRNSPEDFEYDIHSQYHNAKNRRQSPGPHINMSDNNTSFKSSEQETKSHFVYDDQQDKDERIHCNYPPEYQQVDFSRPPPHYYKHQHESEQTFFKKGHIDFTNDDILPARNRNTDIWDTKPTGFPHQEYAGRPPATDHYSDNSKVDDPFDKSIGDTVDIIKRRLQNRQQHPELVPLDREHDEPHWECKDSSSKKDRSRRMSSSRRDLRCRSKSEKKCAKMKKKIMRQLFKMDKSSLHKLVEDPNSSAKFEYALNSLITESRNSLNKEMRVAAERSLDGNRVRHQKDDTVYEDTFMAQMQGVLDPHDIVMLTDIKPMVMAEINKVLQLDEYGQSFSEDDNKYSRKHLDSYDSSDPLEIPLDTDPISIDDDELIDDNSYFRQDDRDCSKDTRKDRCKDDDERKIETGRLPDTLFAGDLENLSDEDEYTFAELDNQYHVAVEYSMIEEASRSPSRLPQSHEKSIEKITNNKEPSSQLLESNSKSTCKSYKVDGNASSGDKDCAKKEFDMIKLANSDTRVDNQEKEKIKEGKYNEDNIIKRKSIKSELNVDKIPIITSTVKAPEITHDKISHEVSTSTGRKREFDEKVLHRKDKRKKSDLKLESNKKVLNKNIIINVSDCASNKPEKCDSGAKSVFNLFFSKPDTNTVRKDSQKSDGLNISYSEKYVKRRSNEKDDKSEDSKNHAIHSKSKSTDLGKEPIIKTETKPKLQTINMFETTPKKTQTPHLSLRNTALVTSEATHNEFNQLTKRSSIDEKKAIVKTNVKTKSFVDGSTQTILKLHSRSTQTKEIIKTTATIDCQTDSSYNKNTQHSSNKSVDVMERMKQIDLEIQQLLQEKFKLYKNFDATSSEEHTMQSLGMAIVNVDTSMPTAMDDSAILETFTNMSEEELQEIALQDINDSALETDLENSNISKPSNSNANDVKHGRQKKTGCKTKSKKKNNIPKVVLKLNKKAKKCNKTTGEYKVVKSPKKQKKVTVVVKPTEIIPPLHRKAFNTSMSLIGQIINDGEDIANDTELNDELENVKQMKSKLGRPKKKEKSAIKTEQIPNINKQVCSVVLKRIVLDERLLMQLEQYHVSHQTHSSATDVTDECVIEECEVETEYGNEMMLQEDMLEISEDIVIGDGDGKLDIPLPEPECSVVDNTSEEEGVNYEQSKESCKVYDFSPSGEFASEIMTLKGHSDAVVAIETLNDDILAASLDGNVYHYSGRDGRLLTTLRGSNFALTCLTVVATKYETTIYTGCLDSRIRYYDLDTGLEKGPECNVLSAIQSMDRAWDTLFVGTRTGFVLQFECKNNLMIPVSSLKFSEQAILALRAIKEGPRKVLLIASRADQVVVKDAQTGLLLRSLEGPKLTVYSLLLEQGRVYCGNNTSHIQVYDLTSGASTGSLAGGKGVVVLRAAGGLVLAGCYDGCVYVYRGGGGGGPVAQLCGAGDMLLSLAVLHTKIIASYKNKSLYVWKIPSALLQEMVW